MTIGLWVLAGLVAGAVLTALAVVWLMNISMMARMFSGPVASAMGEVAAADDAFLAEVLA